MRSCPCSSAARRTSTFFRRPILGPTFSGTGSAFSVLGRADAMFPTWYVPKPPSAGIARVPRLLDLGSDFGRTTHEHNDQQSGIDQAQPTLDTVRSVDDGVGECRKTIP